MCCQPVHVLDAVVNRMKFPKKRHHVACAVGDVIARVSNDNYGRHLHPKRQRTDPGHIVRSHDGFEADHGQPCQNREPNANKEAVEEEENEIVHPVTAKHTLFWMQGDQPLQGDKNAGQNEYGSIVQNKPSPATAAASPLEGIKACHCVSIYANIYQIVTLALQP